jgi:Na+/proline symporter
VRHVTLLDWVVMSSTLAFIVLYGVWKTRGMQTIDTYFRGGNTLAWPTIGLSIMATQASAITFLSAPGQAYEDGLRFVQIYLGLPLAMIVISAFFLPIYYRLNVYTAYEYLEHRFDVRVRYLGACLFLVQRGLAAGITIYAPAIVLSAILGWSLGATTFGIGIVVIVYTVIGGVRAVSQTQKHQMIFMLGGTLLSTLLIISRLPDHVSLGSAIKVAGALGRMNAISFELDPTSRYNVWSGVAGGFFLALSYFGTDQSQVQRYLAGRSLVESRLGLLFNGLLKIPMQLLILFSGVLLFVFYLFTMPPVFLNEPALEELRATPYAKDLREVERRYSEAFEAQRGAVDGYLRVRSSRAETSAAKGELQAANQRVQQIREEAKVLVRRALPGAETKDGDYVFIGFVLRYVPQGLIGLLVAVILCAAMSSTASELTALGSTTTLDLYRRMRRRARSAEHDLLASKAFTALWGVVAISFGAFASLIDNLIEAVNILGSIFYGTVLGIFLVAFFFKHVTGTPVLIGAACSQALVVALFFASDLGFLWFNVVGSAVVVLVACVLEGIVSRRSAA